MGRRVHREVPRHHDSGGDGDDSCSLQQLGFLEIGMFRVVYKNARAHHESAMRSRAHIMKAQRAQCSSIVGLGVSWNIVRAACIPIRITCVTYDY